MKYFLRHFFYLLLLSNYFGHSLYATPLATGYGEIRASTFASLTIPDGKDTCQVQNYGCKIWALTKSATHEAFKNSCVGAHTVGSIAGPIVVAFFGDVVALTGELGTVSATLRATLKFLQWCDRTGDVFNYLGKFGKVGLKLVKSPSGELLARLEVNGVELIRQEGENFIVKRVANGKIVEATISKSELDKITKEGFDDVLKVVNGANDLASLVKRFDNLTPDELKNLFSKLTKSDIKITSSKQWGASTANQNFKLEYIAERVDVTLEDFIPPYKKNTFADEIVLAEDAFFIRVHNQRNQVGRWMITVEDFKALTTDQEKFKDLFALPSMPAKASLVKIPKGTKVWKGQVDGNKWGNGGGVQIQVEDWAKYLDDRDDWFQELGNL